jgi:hypothetical protein
MDFKITPLSLDTNRDLTARTRHNPANQSKG